MARPKSIRKRPFVAPAAVPETELADLIEDGLLIAHAGVRMTVRNLIIVRALRDRVDFDEDWYVGAVKHELRTLAAERRAEAARVTELQSEATQRAGQATHQSDYRRMDAHTLDRRATALSGLADRLEAESHEADTAAEVVRAAREAALADIADSISAESAPDADYVHARAERMEEIGRDLALLELRDPRL